MQNRHLPLLMVLLATALLTGAGCGKPPAEDPTLMKSVESLPGAKEVWAAVDKKDFPGVLTALGKVNEKVTTEDQTTQFKILCYKVREKIGEIAPNDPKATEVLAVLRGMSSGR